MIVDIVDQGLAAPVLGNVDLDRAVELVRQVCRIPSVLGEEGELGLPQRWITEAAYQAEQDIASGARAKVGVNVHVSDDGPAAGRNVMPALVETARAGATVG